MKITTKVGRGKNLHAATYDSVTGNIKLYCTSLKYPSYYAAIHNLDEPTMENVTCKKCLPILGVGEAE